MHLNVIVTYNCNLQCEYCLFECPKPISLELSVFKEVINKYIPFGLESVGFTGGEPILHPNLGEMVAYLLENKIKFSFVSNGKRYKDYLVFVENNKSLFQSFKFSIDGLKNEHDELRQKGNFDEVVQAILFYKLLGYKTAIHFVLTRKNHHIIEKYVNYFKELKVDKIIFGGLLPNENNRELMVSSKTKKDVYKRILALQKKYLNVNIRTTSSFYTKEGVNFCNIVTRPKRINLDPFGNIIFCCNLLSGEGILGDYRILPEEILKKRMKISEKILFLRKEYLKNGLKEKNKSCLFCFDFFKEHR